MQGSTVASSTKTPTHLWAVGGVSLLWNAFGAFDYLMTQLEAEFYMGQFTAEQMAYFTGMPGWVDAVWAFGVWGAFAGSIGLLLRREWAVIAFTVSVVGMALSSIYTMGLSEGVKLMGSSAIIMSAVIWVVAIFLLVYARSQAKKGVLR